MKERQLAVHIPSFDDDVSFVLRNERVELWMLRTGHCCYSWRMASSTSLRSRSALLVQCLRSWIWGYLVGFRSEDKAWRAGRIRSRARAMDK